jgi:hypothetical protein
MASAVNRAPPPANSLHVADDTSSRRGVQINFPLEKGNLFPGTPVPTIAALSR